MVTKHLVYGNHRDVDLQGIPYWLLRMKQMQKQLDFPQQQLQSLMMRHLCQGA